MGPRGKVHSPLGLNTRLLLSVQHLFLNSIKVSSDNSIANHAKFGSEMSEETYELLAKVKGFPAAVLCSHISTLSKHRRAGAAAGLLWICGTTGVLKLIKVGEELSPSLACLSAVNKQTPACLNCGILSFLVIISGILDTFLIEQKKSFYWSFSFLKGNYTVSRCPAVTIANCANMFSEGKAHLWRMSPAFV